jgi:hypothetical protein
MRRIVSVLAVPGQSLILTASLMSRSVGLSAAL